MDFISENENFFRTPNTSNMKNKRAAFSSAKNKPKKVLTDVVNTIDTRNTEFENEVFDGKAFFGVEEMRESFKSPKRIAIENNELKSEAADINDFTCLYSSDVIVNDNFWRLPESMSFSKQEIDIFATRWCNDVRVCHDDIVASSPIKFDSSVFNDSVFSVFNSESYQELLDESFEVVPPELPF